MAADGILHNMGINAAGLDVTGPSNPNWKGGRLQKFCQVCGNTYAVKRAHAKSKFCSLQCVGISQRGQEKPRGESVELSCIECGVGFEVPPSHAHRYRCCSLSCSHKQRALKFSGDGNPNWCGGLSRLPYPWNFREISQQIIKRDGNKCQNPTCAGLDPRLTAHHINYQKEDCRPENLIALCSSCNSKANFDRDQWQIFYTEITKTKIAAGMYPFRFIAVRAKAKKHGGGWEIEEF